jgi:hypothetical protein
VTTRLRAGVRRALRTDPPRLLAAARFRETRRLGDPPALAGERGADSRALEMARDPLEAGCRLAPVLWPVCGPEAPALPFPARPLPSPKPGEPPATASPAVAERTPPQHSTATRAARRRATAIARPSERRPLRVSTRTKAVSSLSAPMPTTFSRNSYIRAVASPRVRPPSLAAFHSHADGVYPSLEMGVTGRTPRALPRRPPRPTWDPVPARPATSR